MGCRAHAQRGRQRGGRTCSILCFDLHIPFLLIILNLSPHYDNCNKANMLIELDGITNKFICSVRIYSSSSSSSSDQNVNFQHNVWHLSKQAGPRAWREATARLNKIFFTQISTAH